MEVFVGLMLGNYVEELLFLTVEGGREPVGHGAADAVFGMATGNTVFEENAMPLELEADGGDIAIGGAEAVLDSVAESALELAICLSAIAFESMVELCHIRHIRIPHFPLAGGLSVCRSGIGTLSHVRFRRSIGGCAVSVHWGLRN